MPTAGENINLHTFLAQGQSRGRTQILLTLSPLAPASSPQLQALPPRSLGRLLAIAEIDSEDQRLKTQTQTFVSQLFRQYKENALADLNTAFENTLEWANRDRQIYFGETVPERLNILVGCLKHDQIQFALSGGLIAYAIYKDKNEFHNLDLLKIYAPFAAGADAFFSNLITGNLHMDNYIIFATPSILDFLTADRLQKIITERNPAEACVYLEKILSQIESAPSYGGILISRLTEVGDSALLPTSKPAASAASISKLINKEQETAKILMPKILPGLSKIFDKKNQKADIQTLRRITGIYERLHGWQNAINYGLEKIGRGLIKVFRWLVVGVVRTFDFLTDLIKQPRRYTTVGRQVVAGLPQSTLNIKNRFLKMNWKQRLLTLGIIVAMMVAVGGGLTLRKERREAASEENYNLLMNTIKARLDEAEGDIIINDRAAEVAASKLLKKIRADLAVFPRDSNNRQKMFDRLQTAADALGYKLQHAITVTSEVEVDWSKTNVDLHPTEMAFKDKTFTLLTRQSPRLSFFDRETRQLSTLDDAKMGGFISKAWQKNGRLLLLGDTGRLVEINPAERTVESKESIWLNANQQIRTMMVYNNNLYAVDTANQQISKHGPSSTGFGKGAFWLQEKLKLDDSVSLAIDGAVYLSKQNGEIWKAEMGRKTNWRLAVEPTLDGPTVVWTQNTSDKLFVLDKTGKRIIIWDKKIDKIVNQLLSSDFSDLRDMEINEKEKKIYLLDGQRILSVKY